MASAPSNATASGHTWFKKETDIPRLKSIRGKAAVKLGLIVIPVAPNHPSYPVYQSQAEWMSGNEDSAWKLFDANWEPFATTHRELSIPYPDVDARNAPSSVATKPARSSS